MRSLSLSLPKFAQGKYGSRKDFVLNRAAVRLCAQRPSEGNTGQLVGPPPATFNYREQAHGQTQTLIEKRYPQLSDLVAEGRASPEVESAHQLEGILLASK